jgi:ABC-type uncharacterized transport system involved in gliding motility auxiliary subunit
MQYGDHPITREMSGRLTMYRLARSVEPLDASSTDVVKLIDTSESSWAASDVQRLAERGEVRLEPTKDRRGPVSIAVARSFKAQEAPKPADAEKKPGTAKEGEAETDVSAKQKGDSEPSASRREGRLVVVGDADFARNQGITRQYNTDLMVNMASWLIGEEEFITIDRKLPRASSVEMSLDQVYNFSYLAIFALPEGLMLLGLVQWWRRRS